MCESGPYTLVREMNTQSPVILGSFATYSEASENLLTRTNYWWANTGNGALVHRTLNEPSNDVREWICEMWRDDWYIGRYIIRVDGTHMSAPHRYDRLNLTPHDVLHMSPVNVLRMARELGVIPCSDRHILVARQLRDASNAARSQWEAICDQDYIDSEVYANLGSGDFA